MRSVTAADIRQAIRQLGLARRPVCVHSSLRSFGHVEGGPDTVIDAFLSESCTLMVPTHSYSFAVGAPPGRRPERNGWDYDAVEDWPGAGRVYTPESQEVSREMGAIPAAVLRREERVRGNHPIDSLAAIGPLARHLAGGQTADDVHAPFAQLCLLDGSVVLMGVGLESMTLLHYAEQQAGRRPFIRWANGPDGAVTEARAGSCSDGFPKLDGVLAPVEQRLTVGDSLWRAFRASRVVALAVGAMQADPAITRCDSAGCARCADSILGGPLE